MHFKRGSVEWYTPVALFERLSAQHGPFTLDPCSDPRSPIWPLVPWHFTADDDGLAQSWGWEGQRVWLNPPYGKTIGAWLERAATSVASGDVELVCCLVPARTDTRWWTAAIAAGAEVEFLRGRVRFVRPNGTSQGAPFPSAVLVFRRRR